VSKRRRQHIVNKKQPGGWLRQNTIALIALLISAGSLYVSFDAKRLAEREDVRILGGQVRQDTNFELIKTGLPLYSVVVPMRWDLVVANNGQRNVSIVRYELKHFTEKGSDQFTGLDRGLYLANGSPTDFPLLIPAGDTVKFTVEIGVPIDSKAGELIANYQGPPFRSLREAVYYLAKNHLDFFGNEVDPVLSNGEVTGLSVKPRSKEPIFLLQLESARGGNFWDAMFWYRALR